jgi:hypothetical protein
MCSLTPQHTPAGRRKFTREEDENIRSLVLQPGVPDWRTICSHLPGRTPRQCRHRYNNYLVAAHQSADWTESEEQVIWDKYLEIGPKWVRISKFLSGRTGNDVKNRFHKHIVKRKMEQLISATRDTEDNSMRVIRPALSAYLQSVLN